MKDIRVAIIGVGYLGKHHAQKLARMAGVKLVGVMDIDEERANQVARICGCAGYNSLEKLINDGIDAAIVATPTSTHYEVALQLLKSGINVLVEKPITKQIAQADELIQEAKQRNLILQVGHIERFNAAVRALRKHIDRPLFIESHRLGPFPNERVKDVNVIEDLMVHDLDIVLSLVDSPIKDIQAIGVPVISPYEDIANARIVFESGCVADITVSRITPEPMRKLRIFQLDNYLSLDYARRELEVYNRKWVEGKFIIERKEEVVENYDAIEQEDAAFIESVRSGTPPLVTGEEGKRALALALTITRLIHNHPLRRELPL